MEKQQPFVLDALHLAVLSAFAVAQPLLDLLGRRPEFFAVRRSEPVDVLLLPVLLCLALPLPLILLEALARLADRRLQRALHAVLVAALVAAILLPPLKSSLAAGPWPPVGCAALFGAAAAAAVDRLRPARLLLTFLIPALAIFPAVFLLRPGVGRVIAPSVVEPVAFAESTTPVVMLIFDELPVTSLLAGPRQIDAVRYPNFAEAVRA